MNRLLVMIGAAAIAAGPALAAPARGARPKPGRAPAPAPAASKVEPAEPAVISTGKETLLVDHLKPESTTVVLFYQPANPDDVDFEGAVRRRVEGSDRLALRLVRLPSLEAPIARQYEVRSTPLGFVYDRNKNLIGKGKTLAELGELVGRGLRTARIRWVDESDPSAAEVYRKFGGGQRPVPEIMKTLSLRPELMEAVMEIAQRFHFTEGFLDRRTKEMVASYVSALNKCKY